jgi:hypothetical protein
MGAALDRNTVQKATVMMTTRMQNLCCGIAFALVIGAAEPEYVTGALELLVVMFVGILIGWLLGRYVGEPIRLWYRRHRARRLAVAIWSQDWQQRRGRLSAPSPTPATKP